MGQQCFLFCLSRRSPLNELHRCLPFASPPFLHRHRSKSLLRPDPRLPSQLLAPLLLNGRTRSAGAPSRRRRGEKLGRVARSGGGGRLVGHPRRMWTSAGLKIGPTSHTGLGNSRRWTPSSPASFCRRRQVRWNQVHTKYSQSVANYLSTSQMRSHFFRFRHLRLSRTLLHIQRLRLLCSFRTCCSSAMRRRTRPSSQMASSESSSRTQQRLRWQPRRAEVQAVAGGEAWLAAAEGAARRVD